MMTANAYMARKCAEMGTRSYQLRRPQTIWMSKIQINEMWVGT